ncbi:hypothetical protein PQR66_09315 [Paraburkholderia agricolaris]|jgi:hypothetical protein|uniref:Uncharacterized protein n=1 Tax=Paraburkholderia agricolaris TaxID=2152888 RepID=A0ABW8ZK39_9BURK
MALDINDPHHLALLFKPGALVFSTGVSQLMTEGRLDPLFYFQRHARGDWGDVPNDQRKQNNDAMGSGGAIQSAYIVHRDLRLVILTRADRSETRITLPDER